MTSGARPNATTQNSEPTISENSEPAILLEPILLVFVAIVKAAKPQSEIQTIYFERNPALLPHGFYSYCKGR